MKRCEVCEEDMIHDAWVCGGWYCHRCNKTYVFDEELKEMGVNI